MQDLEAIVRSLMEDQGKLAVTCIGDTREMGGHAHGAPYVQDAPAPPPPPLGAPLTQPIPVVLNLLMLGFIFLILFDAVHFVDPSRSVVLCSSVGSEVALSSTCHNASHILSFHG